MFKKKKLNLIFHVLRLLDGERGAASGFADGELHHAAHIPAGAFELEFVGGAVVLQLHRRSRLEVDSIETPDRRLVDGDRHLALERRCFRLSHLQVFKVFHHNKGLSYRKEKHKIRTVMDGSEGPLH